MVHVLCEVVIRCWNSFVPPVLGLGVARLIKRKTVFLLVFSVLTIVYLPEFVKLEVFLLTIDVVGADFEAGEQQCLTQNALLFAELVEDLDGFAAERKAVLLLV